MKRIVMGAALWLVACGSTPPAPDLIRRPTESPGAVTPMTTPEDNPDTHEPPQIDPQLADAGCCVTFALSHEADEVDARLIIDGRTLPMEDADAGSWSVGRCIGPGAREFYFEVAYATDDDAGVLWVQRINDAVSSSTDSALAPAVNLFDFPDGGSCEGFDGTAYASLPDGGVE